MGRLTRSVTLALASAGAAAPMAVQAGITVYDQDGKYLEFGGRIQAQYHYTDPDTGSSSDELFFRRLRLYMEGSAYENWMGKWQIDFGKGGQDPSVKDAYIQYKGFGLGDITAGNHYAPFSREALTSSKRQQLVERTFVGDHNYGVPDRQVGLSLKGGNDTLEYGVGAYQAAIDPDTSKLDFASAANDDGAFYTGNMIAGRIDFYPMGAFKMAQGDFDRDMRLGFGVNAFTWSNDDDIVSSTASDYDSVTGVGVDAALRGGGFSFDVQWNSFASETLSDTFTGGIIQNGDGDFDTYAVEGGFMLASNRWELVAGYQALDADAYNETWTRSSVGFNHFFHKHKNKLQVTYRMSSDVDGVAGNDEDELFVQIQHYF